MTKAAKCHCASGVKHCFDGDLPTLPSLYDYMIIDCQQSKISSLLILQTLFPDWAPG